jgi:hypothetical protein
VAVIGEGKNFRIVADHIHLNPVRSGWVGGTGGRAPRSWIGSRFPGDAKGTVPEWLETTRVLATFNLAERRRSRGWYPGASRSATRCWQGWMERCRRCGGRAVCGGAPAHGGAGPNGRGEGTGGSRVSHPRAPPDQCRWHRLLLRPPPVGGVAPRDGHGGQRDARVAPNPPSPARLYIPTFPKKCRRHEA